MRKGLFAIFIISLCFTGLAITDLSGVQDNTSIFPPEILPTDEDAKMALKIFLALSYASIMDKQHTLSKEVIWVIIKGARPRYERFKPDMPFFVYVWLIIKNRYANMDKWIKYYWRFK